MVRTVLAISTGSGRTGHGPGRERSPARLRILCELWPKEEATQIDFPLDCHATEHLGRLPPPPALPNESRLPVASTNAQSSVARLPKCSVQEPSLSQGQTWKRLPVQVAAAQGESAKPFDDGSGPIVCFGGTGERLRLSDVALKSPQGSPPGGVCRHVLTSLAHILLFVYPLIGWVHEVHRAGYCWESTMYPFRSLEIGYTAGTRGTLLNSYESDARYAERVPIPDVGYTSGYTTLGKPVYLRILNVF